MTSSTHLAVEPLELGAMLPDGDSDGSQEARGGGGGKVQPGGAEPVQQPDPGGGPGACSSWGSAAEQAVEVVEGVQTAAGGAHGVGVVGQPAVRWTHNPAAGKGDEVQQRYPEVSGQALQGLGRWGGEDASGWR